MSDNDLIRRGDALAAAADLYRWSIAAGEELEAAIAALPAVAVGVRPLVDAVEALNAACDAMWNDHERLERNPDRWGQKMRIKERHVKAISEAQQRLPTILAALDLTPAPDAAALVDQVRFLAERLREWEGDYINHDEAGTQWIGNVIPPLVRLEAILALLPKGGA